MSALSDSYMITHGRAEWPADQSWLRQKIFTMTVEPAPTNRATCKYTPCKQPIAKGTLRVQTDFHHDNDHGGPSCGAFHLACFVASQKRFGKNGIWKHRGYEWGVVTKPEIQLHGFNDLDEHEQDEVKGMFLHGPPDGSVAPVEENLYYQIGYAPQSRYGNKAKCRNTECGESIDPGVLRIGEPFTGPRGEKWLSWKHVKCFFDDQDRALKDGKGKIVEEDKYHKKKKGTPTKYKEPLVEEEQLGAFFKRLKKDEQELLKKRMSESKELVDDTPVADEDAAEDDADDDDDDDASAAAAASSPKKPSSKRKSAEPAKKADMDEEEEEEEEDEEDAPVVKRAKKASATKAKRK